MLPGKDGLEKMQYRDVRAARGSAQSIRAAYGSQRCATIRSPTRVAAATGSSRSPCPNPTCSISSLEDGAWICVRPSGTEPKIKLYVNARTEAREMTAALLEKLSGAAVEALNARM